METPRRLREGKVRLRLAEQADCAYVLQTGRAVPEGPAAQPADDRDLQRIYPGLETGAG